MDLGGVAVRLLWFGEAHTKGDELIFVEPDRTLISGDVVQNKTMPNISDSGGTPSTWLAVLDKIAGLNAARILPDHSAPGDGSLVASEQSLITEIRIASPCAETPGHVSGRCRETSEHGSQGAASRLAQHQRRRIRQKRLRRASITPASFLFPGRGLLAPSGISMLAACVNFPPRCLPCPQWQSFSRLPIGIGRSNWSRLRPRQARLRRHSRNSRGAGYFRRL